MEDCLLIFMLWIKYDKLIERFKYPHKDHLLILCGLILNRFKHGLMEVEELDGFLDIKLLINLTDIMD
jgi:hypothetical protein